jgi:hypothetical protein
MVPLVQLASKVHQESTVQPELMELVVLPVQLVFKVLAV